MGKELHDDPVMQAVRERWKTADMTYQQLGLKMGYAPGPARQAAWQFIKKTGDPQISMLRKYSAAVGISLQTLLRE